MSIEGKALIAVALVAALGGAAWYVYSKGETAGKAEVQKEWDAAQVRAERNAKADREEGYALAAEYEVKLHDLEKRYASTNARLRTALETPFTCPASGRVGDVLLPASVVDSMFNREVAGLPAPGPSASQPDASVR